MARSTTAGASRRSPSQLPAASGPTGTPFGLPEQIALAEAARDAASRGAQVVLSNHDTPLVRDRIYRLDRGFRFHSTPEVSRAISRKGDSRVAVSEVIAAIGPIAA